MEHKLKLLDPKVDYIFKQIFGQNTPVCNRLLIHLLNSIFEKNGSERIKSIEYLNPYFEIKERYQNLKLTDDLEMHYIELKKMTEIKNSKDLDNLSKWTLFFNDATEVDKIKIIEELEEESEEIAMAVEILKRVSGDEVKRAKYDSRLKWILEKTTILNEAERVKVLFENAKNKADKEEERADKEGERAERAEEEVKNIEATFHQSIKILADKIDIETIATTFSLSIEKVKEILGL